MPLIMTNSKDGQGHKGRYLDISRKILAPEIFMCNMKGLALTVQKLLRRLKFSKNGSYRVQNNGTYRKVFSLGILMWNIKTLARTHRSKFITGSKVQVSERRIERQTEQYNMSPDLWFRGHKNAFKNVYIQRIKIKWVQRSNQLVYAYKLIELQGKVLPCITYMQIKNIDTWHMYKIMHVALFLLKGSSYQI